ncbi:MAG TPA: serine/threonine-protein kinase [Planctomycetota bacterium]|nr:serine/threonine-protein kinase [Planctomycetota bacterium]
MTLPSDPFTPMTDLLVRCVLAFERDGEEGVERILVTAGDLAEGARAQLGALREAGLLLPPELPERIGRYRVLQRIGSGGMGAVFLCEQDAPIRRRVAVKVLRAGMETREILARFALERQALSLLNHPGIAKIFDAGTAESGRPFLVMEHVPGLPLHRYCDERQLSTRERLQLFVRVCEAVQHAHHKGIVHRDLKPGNVLVVDREGVATPVVIDFGVAKSLGGALTGATLMTLPGHMLGTPEYMSPEQATNEQDVDTRTDVYSLGVMLYELLTGTLPIESQRFRTRDDVAKVLREVEPPTPSTRITTLGEAASSVASCRGTDASGLRRQLRGDLDWIVLKAIDKDRNRRYGMPGELAADVQRHLAHEPVLAGRPGAWYRFSKYWARHRLQVSAAGLVLAALGSGLAASLVFWQRAERSSQASAASLGYALSAIDELVQVGDSGLVAVPHLELVRRNLLERSVEFYRGFLAQVEAGDERLRPRIADALVRLGGMQVKLGQHGEAIANLTAGLHSFDELRAGGQPVPVPVEVRARQALAEAHERAGDLVAAAEDLERARARLEPALAAAPADEVELRVLLLRTARSQGKILSLRGDEGALAAFAAAVTLGAPFAAEPERHRTQLPDVIYAGTDHSRQLLHDGHREEAVEELLALRTLWERARAGAVDPAADWQLTTAATELAGLFGLCDRAAEALAMLKAAASAYERIVRDHADVLTYRTGLATARSELGAAMLQRWQLAEGKEVTAQAELDHAAALALAPDDVVLLHNAAFAAISVAQAELELQNQGAACDFDAARAALARAFERIDRLERLPSGPISAKRARLEALRLRARLCTEPDAALADLQAALAVADDLLRADPVSVPVRERRLELLLRLGDARLKRGEAAAARDLVSTALADQLTMRAQAPSVDRYKDRRRDLLAIRARAEAALGDVDAVLAVMQDYIQIEPRAGKDWRGFQNAARLLVEITRGPLASHARRAELLARGREVVQLGLADGAEFERVEGASVSPVMIAVMRAGNWQILVELERLAGDAVAEAAALRHVAQCHAQAFAGGASERSELRLRETCEQWGEALVRAGRAVDVLEALGEVGEWFRGRASLATAAAIAARFCREHGDADAVRERGRALLREAIDAGFSPAQVEQDPELRSLQADR